MVSLELRIAKAIRDTPNPESTLSYYGRIVYYNRLAAFLTAKPIGRQQRRYEINGMVFIFMQRCQAKIIKQNCLSLWRHTAERSLKKCQIRIS